MILHASNEYTGKAKGTTYILLMIIDSRLYKNHNIENREELDGPAVSALLRAIAEVKQR
jgi:hypothetical protein